MPKKILVPIIECGAGHRMPAIAVKNAMERLYPDQYDINIVDFAKECGALGADARMKAFWNYCLAHPRFARASYSLMESLSWLASLVLPTAFRDFILKGSSYIEAEKPDLIFSTHYYGIRVATLARRRLGRDFKVIGLVTDPFDVFCFWSDKRADTLIVCSDKAAKRAKAHGIRPERVRIFDFPINHKFVDIKSKPADIRARYGLSGARPIILTSEGGQGIGRIAGYVAEMLRRDLDLDIICVCGRNQGLKDHLEGLASQARAQGSRTALVPLGFVDNMNELLSIADLCVAKAGASTTFEALILKTPIVFTSWAIQSEKPNVDFCVERGLGWYAPSPEEFWPLIDSLLNGELLAKANEAFSRFSVHNGDEDMARYLHDQIQRPRAILD